ncbi:MAG: D-alanine--D-alanine ligase [Deltaproteobacteria bacterium]|nr:D-alanine--D-alanine ligase [Deltaproteobacteria bacterium]
MELTQLRKKRIGVLAGGISSEKEISLKTGKAVFEALKSKSYQVQFLEVQDNIIETLQKAKIDIIFNALHGTWGEDGVVQSACEMLKIPYTGSHVASSSLCMVKSWTKMVVQKEGILTPTFILWDSSKEKVDSFMKKLSLKPPVIVKPDAQGSTVGISIIKKFSQLKNALMVAQKFDSCVLVEGFISGKEITASVLNGKSLPLIEIKPKSGFYDYKSKYTKGQTEYLCPAPLSKSITQKIQNTSLKAYDILRCRGAARSDFIVDKNNKAWFLEINTLPGMTETSLVPKAAKEFGLSFIKLVEEILRSVDL